MDSTIENSNTSNLSSLLDSNLNTSYFNYIFKHDFKDVLETIRDFRRSASILNKLESNFITDIIHTKGSETWEKDAEYSYLLNRSLRIYVRVADYEETENYARLVWHNYNTDPFLFVSIITLYFYKNFVGNYTSYVIKWNFPSETQIDTQKINEERYNECVWIDKELSKENLVNTQLEKTYINASLEKIWGYVQNLGKLQKIVPLISNSVECGEEITIGSIIKLELDESSFVKLKVVDLSTNLNFCQIEYECVESNPPTPKQLIMWKVEKAEGNFCSVSFTHRFVENLAQHIIEKISGLKKTILLELKQKLDE